MVTNIPSSTIITENEKNAHTPRKKKKSLDTIEQWPGLVNKRDEFINRIL